LQLLDIIMPVAHDTILKSMADGIIILDTNLRVIELNPAAQRIIGGKKSETLGQIYSHVFPGQLGLLELNPDMPETEAAVFLNEGQSQRSYSVRITPIGRRLISMGDWLFCGTIRNASRRNWSLKKEQSFKPN